MKAKTLATSALYTALLGVPMAAEAYQAIEVRDGGTIVGRVSFEGAPPAPLKAAIGKDHATCGQGHVERDPVRVGAKGELRDAIVFLEKVEKGKPWPAASTPTTLLDQKNCRFEPYVQVVRHGTDLTIRNSDPVLHNVHPYEHIGKSRRTLFNLAQPTQGQTNVMKIEPRRGRVVELSCDAHDWMSGWIYVLDHPYYAVVGPDGAFALGDVPPGSYKLVAWHPSLGAREQNVTVAAKAKADVAVRFSAAQ